MFFIVRETDFTIKEKIQILYFYADWMTYHKKMLSMLFKLEEKYKEIEFVGINTDSFPSIYKRFSVESIPTIVILNNGQEVKRVNGVILTSALKTIFADICNKQ